MIGAPGDQSLLCMKPVFTETIVHPAKPFGCLDKCKPDLNVFIFHGFYRFPVNIMLVAAYINSMNGVIDRQVNAKSRVSYKCRPAEITIDIINSSSNSGKQYYGYKNGSENTFFSFCQGLGATLYMTVLLQINNNCFYDHGKVLINE